MRATSSSPDAPMHGKVEQKIEAREASPVTSLCCVALHSTAARRVLSPISRALVEDLKLGNGVIRISLGGDQGYSSVMIDPMPGRGSSSTAYPREIDPHLGRAGRLF